MAIVIMAIVLGGAIAGIIGAILAVPLTAAARDIFRYAYHRVDDPPATPDEAVAMIRSHPRVVEDVPARPPDDPESSDTVVADAGA